MTISLARLEDMSLQHWIKEAILPLKWVERVNNAPLTYNSEKQRFEAEIIWLPNFLDEGRGWVYFDALGTGTCVTNSIPSTEQTTRIDVYNASGSTIDPSLYQVNYSEGAVVASGVGGPTTTAEGVPTTIDFTQYYVSVVDGWPGTEPPALPIVAVEMRSYTKQPFQIGPGRKAVRVVVFHVFATSSAERDDLTEFLHDALYQRHIPILDFREGEPLNYDGTFNEDFDGDPLQLNVNDDGLFYFDDIKVEIIDARRQDNIDINRFRSKITFTMFSFRDGIDFNVL